jgi:alkylation response protein AidB-like acyl-CoA dehydrogenase
VLENTDYAPAELDDQDVAAMAAALDEALTASWDPVSGEPAQVWADYAKLGLFDVVSDFAHPGHVLAALLRTASRHLAPGPLVEEAFIRPWLAARGAGGLAAAAGPADRLALVDPAATRNWRGPRGDVSLSDGVLHGAVRGVAHVPGASTLLVVVSVEGVERLATVGARAPGVVLEAGDSLDPGVSIGTVRFAGCRAEVLDLAPETLRDLRCWLSVFVAAELSGIAEAVVDMTRAQTIQREQFGRPIASFQAVRHIMADMATQSIAVRNLIDVSARELDRLSAPDRAETAAIANAYASDAGLRICEQGLQLHGGIGFVEEHSLHRYFKAALRLHAHYGSPRELYAEIGSGVMKGKP